MKALHARTTQRVWSLLLSANEIVQQLTHEEMGSLVSQEDRILFAQVGQHMRNAMIVLAIVLDDKASPHPETLASADAGKRDTTPAPPTLPPAQNLPHGR